MKKLHIFIIGFKSAGKSAIGSLLAKKLGRKFVDLDEKIIQKHKSLAGAHMSCREILKRHGEEFFRDAEHKALKKIAASTEPLVISVGGGAPMLEANREIMKRHTVIHISTPKSIVFERIMINGRPAFFPSGVDAFPAFQQLWKEREPIFQQIEDIMIKNTGSINDAVETLTTKLTCKQFS